MEILAWWLPIASWSALISLTQDDIVVNWLSLQNSSFISSQIDISNNQELNTYNLPIKDGKWFLSNFVRWKKIRFTLCIIWETRQDLIEKIDLLRKNIYRKNVNIDIKIDWVNPRRVVWNCVSCPLVLKNYNITFFETEVEFESTSPFFFDIEEQSSSFSWITSSLYSNDIEILWTADTDPRFYLLFQSATSVTSIEISIWDYSVSLSQSISAWDYIYIDWETKKVYYNWTLIDYESSWFPVFEPWVNTIWVTCDWTFSYNLIILNKKNYV